MLGKLDTIPQLTVLTDIKNLCKGLKYTELQQVIRLTCTFVEFEFAFFWKPLSIPNSAKKLDDFGGATWLSTCMPPELCSPDWTFSTYSKRDVKDAPTDGLLLVDETGTTGSSGCWS